MIYVVPELHVEEVPLMLLLLPLQMMVMLAVLAVVLIVVIFVVVSVVLSISVCVVSLEAFVAPLHQLQVGMLDHVGSEDQMTVVGGWHGTKLFLLPEHAARTISLLVAIAVWARPRSWPVVVV